MSEINTHNLIVDFGKHKGERWTRLPISYLNWLMNEVGGEKGAIAKAELDRRGTTVITTLQLSGHAIDRASQITHAWKDKGVHSWLLIIGAEALEAAKGAEEIEYQGFKFAFTYGEYYPTMKTIIKCHD